MNDVVASDADELSRLRKMAPRAAAPCLVIKEHFPDFAPAIIFDVGANQGQSAVAFAQVYPQAAIYSFEPVWRAYKKLEAATENLPLIRPFHLAVGRRVGEAFVRSKQASPSNRVVESPGILERRKTARVTMTSGDAFCREHGIDRIGFLKVDTEGYDLDVLIGFQGLLSAQRIDFIDTEAGANRENRRHVPFEAVKAYLEPLGYHLLHIHDLAMDTPFSGRVVLRRVNAMFVSDAFVEAHRVEPESVETGEETE